LIAACVVTGLLLVACGKSKTAEAEPKRTRTPESSSVTTVTSGTASRYELLEVSGDRSVLVAFGDTEGRRPIVYLHGMCADPREDLDAWGNIAQEHGTIVALVGDVPCPDKPGRTMWSEDARRIDERIVDALDAINVSGRVKLDKEDLVLVGESMGAARAELLARRAPQRYARLVLVGSPQRPSPENLRGVKAVANLAGEKEAQSNMREGARVLANAGTASRFYELPGAVHGHYGPEGERVMREAIAFVATP
jgi:pimeloyl-ACP methyl ester carboxylesterase